MQPEWDLRSQKLPKKHRPLFSGDIVEAWKDIGDYTRDRYIEISKETSPKERD